MASHEKIIIIDIERLMSERVTSERVMLEMVNIGEGNLREGNVKEGNVTLLAAPNLYTLYLNKRCLNVVGEHEVCRKSIQAHVR